MSAFLILGDIHYGSFADHPDFGAKSTLLSNPPPMLEGLIHIAKSSGLHFDGIMVPGDLTSTAAPAEFVNCEAAVLKIAKELNVPRDGIYVTYGNHDVDWAISKLAAGRPLSGEDPLYRKIAAHTGDILLSKSSPTLAGPVPGSGIWSNDAFDVLVLNSGFSSCHDQEPRNGNLGSVQLDWLRQLPANTNPKWRILMLHHHPFNLPYPTVLTDTSTLAEGAELLVEIDRLGIDFVLHGHRHHPMLHTTLQHGWRKPVTFLCAGSVGVGQSHRQGGDIPNVFHVLELTSRTEKGSAVGAVHTYRFRTGSGWSPCEYSKETPLDAKQWFGACVTEEDAKIVLNEHLSSAFAANGETVRLPAFDSLPHELRCLPIPKLNELVRNVVSPYGYTMVGQFPAAVIASK